jgi:hypothetical protein
MRLVVLALALGMLLGCSQAPRRTLPPGMPYPTRLGPHMPSGVIPMDQTRCFGGGIGGCTLGGKAQ